MADYKAEDLMELCATIQNGAVLGKLFSELLTPSEIKDLVLRWELLKDLSEGQTQRAIAAKYRISLCKITRGSKILKDPDSVVRSVLVDKKIPQ